MDCVGRGMKKSFFLFTVVSLLLSGVALAELQTNQAADLVLGQPDFETNGANLTQTGLDLARDVVTDPVSGKVFVAEAGNDRILRYPSHLALSNGEAAEAVFGQDDFISNDGNQARQDRLNNPARLYIDHEGRLWVTDQGYNRVLRYENASHRATGTPADGVLGQPDFASSSSGITDSSMDTPIGISGSPNGTLWVSDKQNNRVLRFDDAALKINGAPADAVLGQLDLMSKTAGTSATTMNGPTGLFYDESGSLWVAESGNDRVMRFDNAESLGNGAPADGVLGQPDLDTNGSGLSDSGLSSPSDVVVSSKGTLYVADFSNHRVLGFEDATNLADGTAATLVLGQPGFDTKDDNLTSRGFGIPQGLALDELGRLYVTDSSYDRVTRFSPDGTPGITIKGKKSTRGPNLTLRGTATSNLLVTKVEVKAGRGGFKKASGTDSWKFRVRGLTRGTTRAKVKATSLDGKTSLKTVKIRRR